MCSIPTAHSILDRCPDAGTGNRRLGVMQPYLETTGIDTVDSFLFGRRDDVPPWAGYTIGFHIVQAFLQRNPEASVPSWTALDSREILTRSGYSGKR